MKVMESMIERVAKALCRQAAYGIGDEDWPVYAGAARAAIEEMRMPTSGMLKAGAWSGEFTIDRYQAMIDAALKEEEEKAV